jgi:hypothetical protein
MVAEWSGVSCHSSIQKSEDRRTLPIFSYLSVLFHKLLESVIG